MIITIKELIMRHRWIGNALLLITLSITILLFGWFISNTYILTRDNQELIKNNRSVLNNQSRIINELTTLAETAQAERAKQDLALANHIKILAQLTARFDQNDALSYEVIKNQKEFNKTYETMLKLLKERPTP